MPGPPPKRSDQRRRMNKPDVPVEVGPSFRAEPPPSSDEWEPIARRWYESLLRSGQSVYYAESDWATAWTWAQILSDGFKDGGSPTAAVLTAWQKASSELLTTEGARRRLKIELEAPVADVGDAQEAKLHDLRSRLTG